MSEIDYLRSKIREIAVAAKMDVAATPDQIIARIKLVMAELEQLAQEAKDDK